MITYLLVLFLLIIMLIVGVVAFITYERTWWHYERMIRACDEKLKRMPLAEDEPDNPFALDRRL